jgi:ankyrin repeat protein
VASARRFARFILPALAAAMLPAVLAHAQSYSPGYTFLKAVKDKDGAKVLDMLKQPGSTLMDSRDITSGESALHIVVERRDLTWLNFLLGKGANPNTRDNKGVTPLVLASQIGFVDGVEALIRKGAKVDIPDSTGETPLISAVHKHDVTTMRLLLRAGADPDRADSSGRSARDYATLDGKDSVLLQEIDNSARPASEREGASSYGPSI